MSVVVSGDLAGAAERPLEPPLPVGSLLEGRYRLDRVLGTGAMGCVYRATHVGIGRPVAVKVLRAELGGAHDAALRFKREALASGRLEHPNIVGVSDFGVRPDGAAYLVMEALEGESLLARLRRERRLPWPDALEIMRGVLRGLAHAHARGVVHRDIKPDNIFLAAQGGRRVVKLLDFGIAKLVTGGGEDLAVTGAGMTMGTPAYLSPEQAAGEPVCPESDLYSATVVLFEVLTGRSLFPQRDLVDLMMAHLKQPPPALAQAAPDLAFPPALEALVRRGLAKRAAQRIGSALEYLALLDALEQDAPVALTPVKGLVPAPVKGPTTTAAMQAEVPPPGLAAPGDAAQRRRLVRAGVVAGAAVVVAMVIAAVAGGPRGERRAAAGELAGEHAEHAPAPPPPPPTPPTPTAEEREVHLKALLYDLELGRTCAERRAVIPKLVALGDPRAIPVLEEARDRRLAGVAVLRKANANECLRQDAEAAIAALRD